MIYPLTAKLVTSVAAMTFLVRHAVLHMHAKWRLLCGVTSLVQCMGGPAVWRMPLCSTKGHLQCTCSGGRAESSHGHSQSWGMQYMCA